MYRKGREALGFGYSQVWADPQEFPAFLSLAQAWRVTPLDIPVRMHGHDFPTCWTEPLSVLPFLFPMARAVSPAILLCTDST